MTKLEELAHKADLLHSALTNLDVLAFLACHPDLESLDINPKGEIIGYTSWMSFEHNEDLSQLPGPTNDEYSYELDNDGYRFRQVLETQVGQFPIRFTFDVYQNFSEVDKHELRFLGFMKEESSVHTYTSLSCH